MRVRLTAAILASALVLPVAAHAADHPGEAAFRAIYKELVETDTSHATGDCTLAARRMAARLKAAGFADADLNVFSPEGLPLDGGLIATLPGSDPAQGAVMLLAHLDVVDAKREDWTRDPFTLVEDGGYFYARGSADDKAQAAIWVDSLVRLKQAGARPQRTVKLLLSCGEESGARINNVRWLIDKHPDWIKASFALNEGGGGALKPDGTPLALSFQAGEKVTQNFRVEATNPGGHSSVPRPDNAIYALSTALNRIGAYEFPIRFNDVTRATFTEVGKMTPGPMGAAMLKLVADPTDAAANAIVSKDPRYRALLRTTCVATQVEGGHAINALPQRAFANVNCRMFPSDTPADVGTQLKAAVGDAAATVTAVPPVNPVNAPPPLAGEVYDKAAALAKTHFPGVPIIPAMTTGATDGRFLIAAGVPTYGVPGMFSDGSTNAHGLNERISVKWLMTGRDYLHDLVKAYAGVK
ncbi:M20/M25/M40 family metallo-hydrolase [Polymorphobacter fuscus]|uniref:M20/M25/M40 family metallo-hydrolase n=1 Tax=Sandarakinorhabdus fusca TaxID=1439888 RepID=A0A7C9GW97_9SPHN|nr:M20/M25/M40 family metallo-hydrolase [Polymorphobacter fuscus]KAB7644807.1 M20/M25/M40 family metallo-hydrolase [Polymorphobacter fuscus]MQT18078.1 M20/M25/M40 family metallo-hydrolase [Polymorphobacter fuscus]NJC09395.1 acetylornithine deacetylase/succinyl-diaminopimelate desuccinylase-like protein [Polymorphobacter fuscus]